MYVWTNFRPLLTFQKTNMAGRYDNIYSVRYIDIWKSVTFKETIRNSLSFAKY